MTSIRACMDKYHWLSLIWLLSAFTRKLKHNTKRNTYEVFLAFDYRYHKQPCELNDQTKIFWNIKPELIHHHHHYKFCK